MESDSKDLIMEPICDGGIMILLGYSAGQSLLHLWCSVLITRTSLTHDSCA